jgi:hypothetical protein
MPRAAALFGSLWESAYASADNIYPNGRAKRLEMGGSCRI